MTHPSGTFGFSHLFSAALAEFALHLASLQYLGKASVDPVFRILCAVQSNAPTTSRSVGQSYGMGYDLPVLQRWMSRLEKHL